MLAIQKNLPVDLLDIVRRSPVADIPGAEEILRDCMYRSVEVRCGLVDGEVACVWGLIPPTFLSNSAWLWLLTTEIVVEHKFLFIRNSQRYVEEALKEFPVILGDVLSENTSARRWLKWLGAEFAEPIGRRIPFTIRSKALDG